MTIQMTPTEITTPEPVYGYLQIARAAEERGAIEARMCEIASIYGADITDRIYREEPAPAPELWSLAGQTAHTYGVAIPTMMRSTAQHNEVDLHRILKAVGPSTELLKLMAAVRRSRARGSAHPKVLVPSSDHFDGLGVDSGTVWSLLSDAGAQVMWLDDDFSAQPSLSAPRPAVGVLVEHVVSPYGLATQIAQGTATEKLIDAGFGDMVPAVIAVLDEVVGDIEQAWRTRSITETSRERARLRVSVPADAPAVLVVEVEEPRDIINAQLSPTLHTACQGRIQNVKRMRPASGFGTLTRCVLSLDADSESDRLARQLRRYVDITVGGR
ncbi:hypothetical protein [Nocardia salmonicida]|uniref:hypothetical protein n=1 Tax=Nocardia salmonicida TaxID=53431 RepID=UPI0037A1086D